MSESATKARILLVDDEPLVLEELGGILEDEGFVVETACDGEEGLRLFREHRPDMLISDVRMPNRDGLSLAMAVRQEAPEVPIAVITGHGSFEMAIEALRAGVTDFIRKPVRLDDLSAALLRMRAALKAQPLSGELPPGTRLLERRSRYTVASDIDSLPIFVDRILDSLQVNVPSAKLDELRLALRELVINAVEHGNLAISGSDKAAALKAGRLPEVYAERLADEKLRARLAEVTLTVSPEQITVEIVDQGAGFQWKNLPDPTDPAYLLADHGRGVFLARMSVDALSYNDAGNAVTIVKKLD
ncbi:MAG: response regulator [Deltaproteobacteria bacterium]|nr:response regulator [Deltaproteobacteria bacterium]